ncbi:MAG: SDR family oxidoreductase [Nitrospinaceae bacterium]|nr:SDR family oxidoreductase [Nitrospinaceae bacterium]MBT3432309.1 SDR family oxidoreductase [Nitrospinaceae bacterium]MBT3822749.1 SDR family oxidoreductase [Nitrospinaceae bacterium]MBT4429941.1 SDR family oxidoreductase [Nitrospinaceae bacterium]MBT5368370.1 SDR family oxidoreductase [Nitrospinaceae bacterium]
MKGKWALILGASSGFGGATAERLSREGINIFGVHLDRKATLPNAEKIQENVRANGTEAIFFNVNAADHDIRADLIQKMKDHLGDSATGGVQILLHSLAFGTLKPYITNDPSDAIAPKQMEMTLDVMANSLVYWTQALILSGLMGRGGRIYAMTSSGGHRIWPSYGAVSAAKAALESHIRQLAFELAPNGITANSIQAGVTDTAALRKIPGNIQMIEKAREVNPHHESTTPEAVADAIASFATGGTQWMTGNVIRVDGGEDITG